MSESDDVLPDFFELWLVKQGVTVWKQPLAMPENARVTRVRGDVEYDEQRPAGNWSPVLMTGDLPFWRDIEHIATWVRGDGTDVQRAALADGILEGRDTMTPGRDSRER